MRANGLKRSLYLAYLHVMSPLLEPLRRFVVGFLMPSGKKKTRVLAPVFIACVLVIATMCMGLAVYGLSSIGMASGLRYIHGYWTICYCVFRLSSYSG